jgi:hypothetical protein
MVTMYTITVHEMNISCTLLFCRYHLCPFTRTHMSIQRVKQQRNKLFVNDGITYVKFIEFSVIYFLRIDRKLQNVKSQITVIGKHIYFLCL